MSITSRFSIYALLVALVLSVPLSAHEGHQKNLSDEEMLMMEADPTDVEGMRGLDHTALSEIDSNDAVPIEAMTPAQVMQQKVEENRLSSVSDLIARLHPVAAHFPVALLIVAALAELAMLLRPNLGLVTTVRFLVAGGAIGAVVAALFGWFAGGWRLADRSDALAIHRWNGTTIAVLSLLAWWFAAQGVGRARLRLLLALIAVALVVQGYFGGEMVHGPNHMGFM